MKRNLVLPVVFLLSHPLVTACSNTDAPSPPASQSAAASPAPSVDADFELVKKVTPVDACALLPAEKLAVAFPGLRFEVHQKVEPRLSGYAWDSRCTYWAGVGSMELAKDAPTHTVDIFVNTVVSAAKAQSNLASRHETARTATGYQAQPALGESAYAVTNTGMAQLFFAKGQSEIQMNTSDLKTTNADKIAKLVALAQAL